MMPIRVHIKLFNLKLRIFNLGVGRVKGAGEEGLMPIFNFLLFRKNIVPKVTEIMAFWKLN